MISLASPGTRTVAQRCSRRIELLSRRAGFSSRPPAGKTPDRINWNTRYSFDDTPDVEHVNYRRVSAAELRNQRERPTRAKMLVRDFIEDSLYNPHYGYFPKRAAIFNMERPLDFGRVRNMGEFDNIVAQTYIENGHGSGPGVQMWHTPTEIFKPWYGRAIAQCLVSDYLLKHFPYEDFLVYEIGAGNGTLAKDILDCIREQYPEVYDRTRYNIIEISENLANLQREKLCDEHPCVTVHNKSVFDWDMRESAPCYVLAMEVVDNFAHDMLRYDLQTLEPYQGYVTVDTNGDFSTYYTRVTDPLIASFLALRRRLMHPPPITRLLRMSKTFRTFYTNLPFAPNLSPPEYIPTRLLSLLTTLRAHFPRHRLLLSDFAKLPDAIPGANAPVVQTVVSSRDSPTMVPCSTLLVMQGYFDIMFPTNFEHLCDMYEDVLSQPLPPPSAGPPDRPPPLPPRSSPLATSSPTFTVDPNFFSSYHPKNRRTPESGNTATMGLPVGERKSSVFTHAEFMETYADVNRTRLKSGENPLLEMYKNVKFLF
ncbi:hypothetical protein CERSUDRAFT_134267 [Gelatoporia subvermispora B]|uniref:Protein arginine methyltransferase NDUFAF7 n=1 Tax=Ceriporiopsis subvermispora (strain B) TaxID=914234 RepID=M2QQC2_CERS8|nr:hypothetical protein CERSUDRAFT_134267 [Gelatoporia subvermispora B]